MTQPTKNRGWILPAQIEGHDQICVSMCIPDNQEYIAAFLGAVSALTKWYNWERTGDDQGARAGHIFKEAMLTMSFDCCDMVLSCIQDSPDIRSELGDLIREAIASEIVGETGGGGFSEADEKTVVTGCNLDNLFASITGLIDLVNGIITDFFELVEASSGAIETFQEVLAAVPMTDFLGADELFDLIDKFIENIGQNYEGAYTIALRDDMRCDLFCLAASNPDCGIRFDDIVKYYEGKLAESIRTLDFYDFIELFTQGIFTGSEIVYAMHLFVFGVMRFGGEFLGMDTDQFVKIVQALYNDSDPDWNILCSPCTPPTWQYTDYLATPGNTERDYISIINGHGVYTDLVGDGINRYTSKVVPGTYNNDTVLFLSVSFPRAITLVSFQAFYGRAGVGGWWWEAYNGATLVDSGYVYNDTSPSFVLSSPETVTHLRIRSQSAPGNWHVLDRYTVNGQGSNPWE